MTHNCDITIADFYSFPHDETPASSLSRLFIPLSHDGGSAIVVVHLRILPQKIKDTCIMLKELIVTAASVLWT